MRILVRLPNWLGDAVLAVGFLGRLQGAHPGSTVHVIVRDEIADFVRMLPQVSVVHACSRRDLTSPIALYRLARRAGAGSGFDVFYCLPASFSSAWMGYFSGSRRCGENRCRFGTPHCLEDLPVEAIVEAVRHGT